MGTNGHAAFKVRRSRVHGLGVFAVRAIPKGTRIVEYLGDRITHREADRRYENHEENDNHTFLFSVDRTLVIDAGVGGNDARFINHSCDPNCEAVEEDGRIYIEAIRNIQPGAELTYDYQLTGISPRTKAERAPFGCECGAPNCRGTMLGRHGRNRSATVR